MLFLCGEADFCKENHYFNTQIFSESITLQMPNVITIDDFQIDFCLFDYYQYHMVMFSSPQAEIPVMIWIYSKNLDLKFPSLSMPILKLWSKGDR